MNIFLNQNLFGKSDLSNYAIKADLKNATGVDTSNFAKKYDLASLKSEIDKSDIDTSKNYSSLSKWCSKNEVLIKTVYDELVKRANAIQTTDTINLIK